MGWEGRDKRGDREGGIKEDGRRRGGEEAEEKGGEEE